MTQNKQGVIFEIRAGAGGNEAGLFATDLFRMYSRYAQNQKWDVKILDSHNETEKTSNNLRNKILEYHNIKHIMDEFIANVL